MECIYELIHVMFFSRRYFMHQMHETFVSLIERAYERSAYKKFAFFPYLPKDMCIGSLYHKDVDGPPSTICSIVSYIQNEIRQSWRGIMVKGYRNHEGWIRLLKLHLCSPLTKPCWDHCGILLWRCREGKKIFLASFVVRKAIWVCFIWSYIKMRALRN